VRVDVGSAVVVDVASSVGVAVGSAVAVDAASNVEVGVGSAVAVDAASNVGVGVGSAVEVAVGVGTGVAVIVGVSAGSSTKIFLPIRRPSGICTADTCATRPTSGVPMTWVWPSISTVYPPMTSELPLTALIIPSNWTSVKRIATMRSAQISD
jgi:hypothetical protein